MARRTLTAELKKKIAIEAIKEQRTINEIASEYQVHPVQVSKWKRELLEGAVTVFQGDRKRKSEDKEKEERESTLEQKIGRLTVENDWLKKKLGL